MFFRAHTKGEANKLGVFGYAKNKDNGDVEIFAQGEEKSLKAFIEWCKKGSPSSKVEQVEYKWIPLGEVKTSFETF